MRQFLRVLWLAGLTCMLFGADSPPMAGVHSVYLLPMGAGLDQFLAARLTNAHIFVVVTDPAKAEAVFTDKLGEAFQRRLEELCPSAAKPKKTDEAKDKDKAGKDDTPHPASSFGQGKGTIFLVDTKTRSVLWSIYEKPRNSSPDEMNRVAGRVTEQLKRELVKK